MTGAHLPWLQQQLGPADQQPTGLCCRGVSRLQRWLSLCKKRQTLHHPMQQKAWQLHPMLKEWTQHSQGSAVLAVDSK